MLYKKQRKLLSALEEKSLVQRLENTEAWLARLVWEWGL